MGGGSYVSGDKGRARSPLHVAWSRVALPSSEVPGPSVTAPSRTRFTKTTCTSNRRLQAAPAHNRRLPRRFAPRSPARSSTRLRDRHAQPASCGWRHGSERGPVLRRGRPRPSDTFLRPVGGNRYLSSDAAPPNHRVARGPLPARSRELMRLGRWGALGPARSRTHALLPPMQSAAGRVSSRARGVAQDSSLSNSPPGPRGAARRGPVPEPATFKRVARQPPEYPIFLPPSNPKHNRRRAAKLAGYRALAVVGLLVLVGGLAYAIYAGRAAKAPLAETPSAVPQPQPDQPGITVAVINGTTQPGLAARAADEVQKQGFELGRVTGTSERDRAESVVLYTDRAGRQAKSVGRRLRLASVQRADRGERAVAGDASVIVAVGADAAR